MIPYINYIFDQIKLILKIPSSEGFPGLNFRTERNLRFENISRILFKREIRPEMNETEDIVSGYEVGNTNETLFGIEGTLQTWSEEEKNAWIKQQELKLHCDSLSILESNDTSIENYCPRVWDKIMCWPPTPPDTTVQIPCSSVPEFNAEGNATRYCDSSGKWFTNGIPAVEESGTGWSNYSQCISPSPPEIPLVIVYWLPSIKQMSLIGYSFSLITLLISFSILISLRKLRCPRNILHLHLFASFIFRAGVVLLKEYISNGNFMTVVALSEKEFGDYKDVIKGSWWCKLVIVIWQYFILANYSWILMEGLYLHNLIFMALFSDSSAITLYIILGWGIPFVCVLLWTILRLIFEDVHCWTVHKVRWVFWLCIRFPVALSNFISFFFFLNVTRVLLLKLRSSVNPESMKYRKLGKSTLVLVPLFGVHYFLLWGLSTSSNVGVELAWLFLDQVFASFQGFFVAVLYCLMNGEVRQELRRIYSRYKGDNAGNATHSTMFTNTRTYMSRGRTSIHSISDRRGDLQTPSPQMGRTSYDGSVSPSNRHRELSICERSFNSREPSPEVQDLLGPMTEYETCKLRSSSNNLSQPGRNSSPEDIPLLFIADTSVEDKEFHVDMTTDFSVNKTHNSATPNHGNNKVDSNKSKNENLASDGFKKLCVKLNPNSHVAESQITSESTLLCEENESML